MSNCKTVCPECPYSRKSIPGVLGGSPPERFVGQAHGPFMLPCHMHYPKDDPRQEWRCGDGMFEMPQCAGAAIFRANVGRDKLMPKEIHQLPADRTEVFGSYAEFYAHHKGISLFEAERQLTVMPPAALLTIELEGRGVRTKKV